MSLIEPVNIGRHTARNRLLFGPHETNLSVERGFSAEHRAYYARRAAGGCGTVVLETASVHESDWPYERAPLAARCGPGWSAAATALHPFGALILGSLGHAGLQGSSAYHQQVLWAPSRFPDPASREVPLAIGQEQIQALVEGFAAAAALALASGLDGVEVEAGANSLLRQFLSGVTNTREDAYGQDRSLLVREVLAAVRRAAGPDAIVGLRLSCDEQAPWAGITPEAAPALAAGLVDGSDLSVDYVVAVRAGPYDSGAHRPDGHTSPGFAIPLAAGLRAALPTAVAVVAQGSIVDLASAREALAAADLVEMTRAQIADPDLAAKLGGRMPGRVRPCVLCNQACRVRDARNPVVSCVGEPSAGHETVEPEPATAEPGVGGDPLEVLVVGAGPAGLEAARVAALVGHRVTIVDRASLPGGSVSIAASGAGRERLALLIAWLAHECQRLGVLAAFGQEAGAAEVQSVLARGGRVLIATGGEPSPPPWHAQCALPLVSSRTVLVAAGRGELDGLPPGPVVVDDPVGGSIGISIAETLAAAGRQVTLVTQDPVAGSQLSRSGDLAAANSRLAHAGVLVARRSLLRTAGPLGAVLEDRYTGERSTVPAALLVYAGHDLPYQPIPPMPGITVIGDAVAPRSLLEAVLEGRRAALSLAGA